MKGRLHPLEQGDGRVHATESGTTLLEISGAQGGYVNAQLDDYHGLPRAMFPWRAQSPGRVRLSLRARFHGLGARADESTFDGTAGFGFWNAPLGGGGRWPILPTALWFFFGGPSSDMAFARGVAGQGWKAACIDAHSPMGYALAACAPAGFLLMRKRGLYARVWPWVQRRLGIAERALPYNLMREWHTYTVEWHGSGALFRIDNEVVHQIAVRIPNPLGLVIWIDNQYLVATPQGRLRWGTVKLTSPQGLEIGDVCVENAGAEAT